MTDFVGELTKRLLIEAGIESGMRVLDVGCGQGDVSLLVAGLVGERGKALGVDRDARAVVAAGERARALGLANASFAEANLTALPAEYGGFDAIVGRRVLMYQPDAAAAIKHLVPALEPGGVMFFLEHDATVVPTSKAPLLLHERVHHWIWETVRREGANIHMGAELRSSLARAGLAVEQVRAEAIVQTPEQHYPVGNIVRAMLARIVQQGVAKEDEIAVETLDQRLIEERAKANATYIGEIVFGAWARKPTR